MFEQNQFWSDVDADNNILLSATKPVCKYK